MEIVNINIQKTYINGIDASDVFKFPSKISRSAEMRNYYCGYDFRKHKYIKFDNLEDAYDYLTTTSLNPSAQIADDDKVFLSTNTAFPALLLGRLGVPLTRTTKQDKADKIVIDTACEQFSTGRLILISDTSDFMVRFDNNITTFTKTEFVNKVNYVKESLERQGFATGLSLYFPCSVDFYNSYISCKKYPTKVVSLINFVKYIQSKLPELTETELDNVCGMIKAQDEEIVGTGIGTLQYYNISKHVVEISEALASHPSYFNLPNNKEAQYLYYLLNFKRGDIISTNAYFYARFAYYQHQITNPFADMTVKDKVLKSLRSQLLESIKTNNSNDLKRLGVDVYFTEINTQNDQNGTTDSGN